MKIDFAARVEVGKREYNDDRVLISEKILDQMSYSGIMDIPGIAIVCDGCGGYAGGGIAAQTVLELMAREEPDTLEDTHYLAQVLKKCQSAVMEKKKRMPQYASMCTTIAGCIFGKEQIIIFHSGDSRVYRYDGWNLARMTRDHSPIQNMIDTGLLTIEEARVAPNRNLINRCIGIYGPEPEIYVSRSSINSGEKYLLCSDGLWESLSDTEIQNILDRDIALSKMADQFVTKALDGGSHDNISICICAAHEE